MDSGSDEDDLKTFSLRRISQYPLLSTSSQQSSDSPSSKFSRSVADASICFVSPCFLAFHVEFSSALHAGVPFDSSTITILDVSRPDCHSWPLYVSVPSTLSSSSSSSSSTVSVTSLCELSSGQLLSGYSDGSIRVWKISQETLSDCASSDPLSLEVTFLSTTTTTDDDSDSDTDTDTSDTDRDTDCQLPSLSFSNRHLNCCLDFVVCHSPTSTSSGSSASRVSVSVSIVDLVVFQTEEEEEEEEEQSESESECVSEVEDEVEAVAEAQVDVDEKRIDLEPRSGSGSDSDTVADTDTESESNSASASASADSTKHVRSDVVAVADAQADAVVTDDVSILSDSEYQTETETETETLTDLTTTELTETESVGSVGRESGRVPIVRKKFASSGSDGRIVVWDVSSKSIVWEVSILGATTSLNPTLTSTHAKKRKKMSSLKMSFQKLHFPLLSLGVIDEVGGDWAVLGVSSYPSVLFFDLKSGESLGSVSVYDDDVDAKSKSKSRFEMIRAMETLVIQTRPVCCCVGTRSSRRFWMVPYPGSLGLSRSVDIQSDGDGEQENSLSGAIRHVCVVPMTPGTVLCGDGIRGGVIVRVRDGLIVGRSEDRSFSVGGDEDEEDEEEEDEEEAEPEAGSEEEEEEGEVSELERHSQQRRRRNPNRHSRQRCVIVAACPLGSAANCVAVVCEAVGGSGNLSPTVELWRLVDRRSLSIRHEEAALAGVHHVVGGSFSFWNALLNESGNMGEEELLDLANEVLAMTEEDCIASFAYALKGGVLLRRSRRMRTHEDRDKSCRMLDASLSLYPRNLMALFLRAEARSAAMDWDLAVEDYEKIVSLVGGASDVDLLDQRFSPSRMRFFAGSCCFQNGDYDRAASFMRSCSENDSAWRWFVQGASLRHIGHAQSAMTCLSRILSGGLLEGDLSESKVRHERAVSAFQLGQFAVALADLEHVVESTKIRATRRQSVVTLGDPGSSTSIPVSVAHLLTQCYEKVGKYQEAKQWASLIVLSLRRMGKSRRHSLRGEECSASEASAQLGRICLRLGDTRHARDAYVRAIEEADTHGTSTIPLQWYLDLAACQRKLGEYASAMRTMVRCTEEFAVLGLVHLEKARLVMHEAEQSHSSGLAEDEARIVVARTRAIGFLNEGIEMMQQVDSEGKETAMLLVERGRLQSESQMFELARDDLVLAVSLDGENGQAWLLKGKVHGEMADYENAVDSLTTALAVLSETLPIAEARFYRAKAHLEQERYASAASDLADCIDLCPDFPGASQLQESVTKNRKLRACESKVHSTPNDPQSWLALSECHAELGQAQEALHCLNKVVELELTPDLHRVRYLRAEVLLKLGNPKEALHDLDEYVHYCEDDNMGWYLRGRTHRMLDNFEGAIDDLTTSIDLNSAFVDAIVERGKVFLQIGMYDKAEADMSIASFLNANRAEVWVLRGRIRMQMDQPDLAVEDFVRASRLDQNSGEAWYWRAQVMEMEKKPMLIFEYLSRALLRDPSFENRLNALRQRATTSLDLSIFDQGVRDCLEVIRLQPEDHQIHLLTYRLYEEMSQYRNAIHHIDEALLKCPTEPLLAALKRDLLPKRRFLERQRLRRRKDVRRRVGLLRKRLRQFTRFRKRMGNLDDIEELWGLIDREISSLTWLFEEEEMGQHRIKGIFDALIGPFLKYVSTHRIVHQHGGIRYLQEGDMEDGFLTGEGRIYSWDAHGDVSSRVLLCFEGMFAKGLKNGPGKEYDRTARVTFEGDYVDGVRHGQGSEFFSSGRKRSSGVYLEGKREGWFDQFADISSDETIESSPPSIERREFWRDGALWRYDIAYRNLVEFDSDEILQVARQSDRIGSAKDGWKSVFRVKIDGSPYIAKIYSLDSGNMSSEGQRRDFCDALEQWVKDAATLSCPNILRVLGFGSSPSSGKTVGFLMPFCELSVRRWIAQSDNPSLLDKLRIALGTCRGLKYLHEIGLVHGCLHWSNVVISDRDKLDVHLCDCGLRHQVERVSMRIVEESETAGLEFDSTSSLSLAQAKKDLSLRRLHPLYFAPELLSDASAVEAAEDPDSLFTPEADVFSFGICLYVLLFLDFNPLKEIVSGFSVPCPECVFGHRKDLWRHILECGLRPEMPIDMRPEYEATKRIMTRCWAQEPHDRLSLSDVEHFLLEILSAIEQPK